MIHQREKLGALGSLLAGVAHELNNPLSIVVAQSMLLEEATVDPTIAKRIGRIRAAGERCARIVRTFLAMARQRPPSRSGVDMNQAVEAALDLLGYNLRTAGVELRRDLAPGLPAVWGDPDEISQVLTNLIVNAQQALSEWGGTRRVTVATRWLSADDIVEVSVVDSGPGVPAAIRSRIFEPFFTTKPVGVGTGIGLSVCHSIISAHGGTITIEDAPGGGAAFVVRLPTGKEAVAAAPAEEKARAEGKGARVLVVDDEPEVGETLAEILTGDGYRVERAESGGAALELLRAGTYDAVLTDVRMPDVDGITLYQRLIQLEPTLARRVIVVTGDTLSGSVRSFLDNTGLACIEKPFVPADVRRVVAETLGAARPTP
jgi:two-component system NtrC family sensor kinase